MMKLRILILFLLTVLKISNSLGQGGNVPESFFQKKLLVVLGKYPQFDEKLKEGFSKFWTVTKFEFINFKDLPKYADNPEYGFFIVHRSDFSTLEKTNGKVSGGSNVDCFVFGMGPQLHKNHGLTDKSLTVAVDPYGEGKHYFEAEAIRALKILHDYAKALSDKKISSFAQYDSYVNKNFNSTLLANKTLLIDSIDFKGQLTKDCYPFKIQLISRDKIDEAIINYDPNIVYYNRMQVDVFGYNYFIDAQTGNLIYYKMSNFYKVNCKELQSLSSK